MIINTNVTALRASRLLTESSRKLGESLARLSSGSKHINISDDPGGLGAALKLDAQVNRTSAAKNNIANANSFSLSQDGFLQNVQTALERMSELSVVAQDVTKSNTDRSNYAVEFSQLQNYISDIGTKTYNGTALFASSGQAVTIDGDAAKFTMQAVDLTSTVVTTGMATIYSASSTAIGNTTSAGLALSNIQTAIQNLADMRAKVGANIQRLNMTDDQVNILNENLASANSRIKDIDVADETTEFARFNILVQSGTAMLAQANMLPSMALQLIG